MTEQEELLALADTIDRNAEVAAPIDEAACLLRNKRTIAAALRLAAKPAEDGPYLVWSNQHRAWWHPNSAGYTTHVHAAGRYSREEAMSISSTSRDGWRHPEDVPEELAIAERDLPAFASTTGESKQ